MTAVCRCWHRREAHDHYRRGTDCSGRGCRCPRYRRRWIKPGSWTWTVLFLWAMRREIR